MAIIIQLFTSERILKIIFPGFALFAKALPGISKYGINLQEIPGNAGQFIPQNYCGTIISFAVF